MVHEHPKPSSLCLFLDVFGIFIRVSPLSTSTSASAEPRSFFHLSPTVGEPNSADHRLSSIATWCWELELSIGHWYAHALSKAESRLDCPARSKAYTDDIPPLQEGTHVVRIVYDVRRESDHDSCTALPILPTSQDVKSDSLREDMCPTYRLSIFCCPCHWTNRCSWEECPLGPLW